MKYWYSIDVLVFHNLRSRKKDLQPEKGGSSRHSQLMVLRCRNNLEADAQRIFDDRRSPLPIKPVEVFPHLNLLNQYMLFQECYFW